jgi:acetyltransferase-like isoleucine patch superfamily enzyme
MVEFQQLARFKRLKKMIKAILKILFKELYQLKRIYPQLTILFYIKYKLGLADQYWYVHKTSEVRNPQNIYVGINSLIGARPGNYIQGIGGIFFGNYIQIGPNANVMSSNHDIYDNRIGHKRSVVIDDYCWIGAGAIILPGVILGRRTIVAAGAVVTKSFEQGFCILAGNPAKIITELDANKFTFYKEPHQYYGVIDKKEFRIKYQRQLFKHVADCLLKYARNKENVERFIHNKSIELL